MRCRSWNNEAREIQRQRSDAVLRRSESADVVRLNMTGTFTIIARMGLAVLVGGTLTRGICGAAAAKARKRHWHGHSAVYGSRGQISGTRVQLLQQPVRLGAMRYYGGPKSPMWRGPVEN